MNRWMDGKYASFRTKRDRMYQPNSQSPSATTTKKINTQKPTQFETIDYALPS